MPLPNAHVAHVAPSGNFKTLRRVNDKFGPGIDALFGIAAGKATLVTIYFDASKFTASEAKAWLAKHGYEKARFDKATKGPRRSQSGFMYQP